MAARRRKTLVVCRTCHDAVHAGNLSKLRIGIASLESCLRGNVYGQFGGGQKEKGCLNRTSPAAYPTILPLVIQHPDSGAEASSE